LGTEATGNKRVDLPGAGLTMAADRWSDAAGPHKGVVVLLHGGGQTRHSWRATGERLGGLGWIAYAVDLRGHGDSEWAEHGEYGLTAHLGDVLTLVGEIRRREPGLPIALVGASLGGMVSLIATGENPGFAQALVLVDVVVKVEETGSARVRDFMMSAPDGFESLEDASAAIASYNPHRRRSGSLEGLKKNLRLRGGRWHWHWDPRSMQIDYTQSNPELPNSAVSYERSKRAARDIRCPVLLVRGKMSDVVSDEGVAEMRELVPQTRVVDIRDAGHMVAGDDNDVFTAGLVEFLDTSVSVTR
jgi:pimeloyl-ACP methyl ester carboxylesterase